LEERISFVPVIKAIFCFRTYCIHQIKVTYFKYVMWRWKRWISCSSCFSLYYFQSKDKKKEKKA